LRHVATKPGNLVNQTGAAYNHRHMLGCRRSMARRPERVVPIRARLEAARAIVLPAKTRTTERGSPMATATSKIRPLTASAFRTPAKFTEFCRNGGKPLGGIIDGEQVAGSMNATFQTIDPGSQEVLATVCEMGDAEVARAVAAAQQAFNGSGRS